MDSDLGTAVPVIGPGIVVDLFGGTPRFATVRARVATLRAIVANGTSVALFTVEAKTPCSPWLAEYRERLAKAVTPWLEEVSVPLAEAWTNEPGLNPAHRIALQRLTLRSNTELLALVVDSSWEFEQSGQSQLLDPSNVQESITALTETLIALGKKT